VNPLQPEYVVRDDQNKAVTIGEVEGSAPTKIRERKRGLLNGCLEVADIHGSAAGSRRLGAFHSTSRRHFLNPNDISDIGGAQPDTLKKGVQGTRVTDQLNPDYQIPGSKEQSNVDNDPFGGSSLDPRFIAARKAAEAREAAMKRAKLLPPTATQVNLKARPFTTASGRREEPVNVYGLDAPAADSRLNIRKPSAEEVKSSKGFSARSNSSHLSTAQKLDKFIA